MEAECKRSSYFSVILIGFIIHVLYEAIFISLNMPKFMTMYNILSIIVFGVGAWVLNKKEDANVIFACFFEVSVFITLAIFFIGWDYEFQSWYISITVMAVTVHFKNKGKFYFVALLNFVLYSMMFLLTHTITIEEEYGLLHYALYFINIAGSFFMILLAERLLNWSKILEEYHINQRFNKMKKQDETDELTELYNRHKMKELLNDMNEMVGDKNCEFYISFADIDNFKSINDSYGHDIGDKVLRSVAGMLKRELGSEHVVSRWGGEEFLILFYDVKGHAEVFQTLDSIRKKISYSTFEYNGIKINFTVTFGATSSLSHTNVYDMAKKADELMYLGKCQGKNVVLMDSTDKKVKEKSL